MPRSGCRAIMAIAIAALRRRRRDRSRFSGRRCGAKGSGTGRCFDPRDPGLRQVLLLMGPGTIGLAATQVNLFVNTLLATSQGTGAVSWLTYAFRADVSADRTVRRVDRDRGPAGRLATAAVDDRAGDAATVSRAGSR